MLRGKLQTGGKSDGGSYEWYQITRPLCKFPSCNCIATSGHRNFPSTTRISSGDAGATLTGVYSAVSFLVHKSSTSCELVKYDFKETCNKLMFSPYEMLTVPTVCYFQFLTNYLNIAMSFQMFIYFYLFI